jgi:peptide/nickel transport system substrate-binding protein
VKAAPASVTGAALLPLALAAALALGGCRTEVESATDEAPDRRAVRPAYGDTFIDRIGGNISGLIPNIVSDLPSHEAIGMIYNGLVTTDRDLNFVPDLAESFTVSADCRELGFRLRRNVKWHDGQPFTAADVLFTYETMIHPKTPAPAKDDFLAVERIEAPDPYTVNVRYKAPHPKGLLSWSTAMLPRHLLEKWVQEGKLRESPQNWSAPIGTGPYKFSELRAGEKVVLVANPDYFGGRPYISRVVFRIIPSEATAFLELKAKGLDSPGLSGGLTALQYKRQTDYPAFRKAYQKFSYARSAYTYLGFNLKDPRFADRRVRHAFAHAINRRQLIEGVVLGLASEATGPYKPGTWAYSPNAVSYRYDPARAAALLAEAGWKEKNADGILVKDGRPFTFELLTNQGNDERKKIAEMIQASLREVGVGVEIRTIEWASFLKEYIRKRRFEAVILGWSIGLDPDQSVIWHSSKTAPEEHNYISYANPEVDALLEQGRSTCVQAKRARAYRRVHEILAEDQPYIFLYFRYGLPVVASRVHGVVMTPNGIGFNFPEWFVPRHLHRYTAG